MNRDKAGAPPEGNETDTENNNSSTSGRGPTFRDPEMLRMRRVARKIPSNTVTAEALAELLAEGDPDMVYLYNGDGNSPDHYSRTPNAICQKILHSGGKRKFLENFVAEETEEQRLRIHDLERENAALRQQLDIQKKRSRPLDTSSSHDPNDSSSEESADKNYGNSENNSYTEHRNTAGRKMSGNTVSFLGTESSLSSKSSSNSDSSSSSDSSYSSDLNISDNIANISISEEFLASSSPAKKEESDDDVSRKDSITSLLRSSENSDSSTLPYMALETETTRDREKTEEFYRQYGLDLTNPETSEETSVDDVKIKKCRVDVKKLSKAEIDLAVKGDYTENKNQNTERKVDEKKMEKCRVDVRKLSRDEIDAWTGKNTHEKLNVVKEKTKDSETFSTLTRKRKHLSSLVDYSSTDSSNDSSDEESEPSETSSINQERGDEPSILTENDISEDKDHETSSNNTRSPSMETSNKTEEHVSPITTQGRGPANSRTTPVRGPAKSGTTLARGHSVSSTTPSRERVRRSMSSGKASTSSSSSSGRKSYDPLQGSSKIVTNVDFMSSLQLTQKKLMVQNFKIPVYQHSTKDTTLENNNRDDSQSENPGPSQVNLNVDADKNKRKYSHLDYPNISQGNVSSGDANNNPGSSNLDTSKIAAVNLSSRQKSGKMARMEKWDNGSSDDSSD